MSKSTVDPILTAPITYSTGPMLADYKQKYVKLIIDNGSKQNLKLTVRLFDNSVRTRKLVQELEYNLIPKEHLHKSFFLWANFYEMEIDVPDYLEDLVSITVYGCTDKIEIVQGNSLPFTKLIKRIKR